ncbi:MAG TPA: hypothetical protein PLO33_04715 [Kouleothrix sp.]|uniref:hypothetical protein n=1 Tax=Kouleothrix sp. TaxID=2779161 RepID=UPI002C4A6904|nr:hypothetical protein [Kouleothrix sp.]HRC74957.1 hypothetical protein [Kouleothrix sp.]
MTRGFWFALGAALLSAVGGMMLLGLPGALIFAVATPVITLLFGAGALDALPADSYWPIAIFITLLWPPSIVAGYLLAYRRLAGATAMRRHASFVAVLAVWGLVLSVAMFLLGRKT